MNQVLLLYSKWPTSSHTYGGMALLLMPRKQTWSLPIAFSSFSVCSHEGSAFITICLVGRRFPQQSSRWAAHSFNLAKCSAEWPCLQTGLVDRHSLPSFSVMFLWTRLSLWISNHLKPREQVSVTTTTKSIGKRRRVLDHLQTPSVFEGHQH